MKKGEGGEADKDLTTTTSREVHMTECDFCYAEFDIDTRRVVTQARPSSPTELVAILWGCGNCDESKDLPTAEAVITAVEDTGEWAGESFLFVTV